MSMASMSGAGEPPARGLPTLCSQPAPKAHRGAKLFYDGTSYRRDMRPTTVTGVDWAARYLVVFGDPLALWTRDAFRLAVLYEPF